MTEQTSISVERVVDASPATVFDLVSNPERHREIDASGMVGTDEKSDRIAAVGDTFVMNMTYVHKGRTTEYQVRNHVTGFADGKLIAWRPGSTEEDEPFGWEWLYELEPQGADQTLVRLTYGWRDAPAEVIKKYGIPFFTADELDASLGKLAEATTG